MNRKRLLAIVAFIVLSAFVIICAKVDEQKVKDQKQSEIKEVNQAKITMNKS